MGGTAIILSIGGLYLLVILFIGYIAFKRTTSTVEDYFMASRQFGTIVLLMAIFATNMTAFIMIGMPGQAYHIGIGVFGWGIIFCCTYPVFFRFLGYPAWLLGKKYGYITPTEMYADRYESHAVNITIFVLLTYYTVPYLVLGVMGGGLAIAAMSRGAVPYWLGALIISAVTFAYTFLGGMRGTAWTNTVQGFVFIVASWIAVFVIADALGGFSAITEKVLAAKPALLQRTGFPQFTMKNWFSFMLVIQAGIAFPHLWIRLLTGKTHVTMKRMNILYPLAGVLFWFPCILVGIWGAALIPGLVGMDSDKIYPMMVAKYTNPVVGGIILAGILAAIMSSLDAMILTTSTMFTRDILAKYTPQVLKGREVSIGKLFVILVSLITYLLALVQPASIVKIASYAFSGYVLTIPILIAGLYWRRSSKEGVVVGLILGTITLLLLQFGMLPKSWNFGFMPIVPSLFVTIVAMVIVSYATKPASQQTLEKFHGFLDGILKSPKAGEPSRRVATHQ